MQKKINNLIWEIFISPSMSPELTVGNNVCAGVTWCMQQKIHLSADLDRNNAKGVISHELAHAFLYSTQIKKEEPYTEEEMCEFISKWGEQILTLTNEIYDELYPSYSH